MGRGCGASCFRPTNRAHVEPALALPAALSAAPCLPYHHFLFLPSLETARSRSITRGCYGSALLSHHPQSPPRVFNDAQQGSQPAYKERQRHLHRLAARSRSCHPCCALPDAHRLLDSSHRAPTPYVHPRLRTSCLPSLHNGRPLERLHDNDVVSPSNCQKPIAHRHATPIPPRTPYEAKRFALLSSNRPLPPISRRASPVTSSGSGRGATSGLVARTNP